MGVGPALHIETTFLQFLAFLLTKAHFLEDHLQLKFGENRVS
jgi:hypothetical protein